MGETVRFSELVKASGTPQVYLPLSDPNRDRDFMRAVREDRVLSLKQEPTGTKKDFGVVGFLSERHVSYLIFSKRLTSFKGRRVIGIKYDALSDAGLSTPPVRATGRGRSTRPARPKPKPRPRPKRFTATVRRISTNELKVTVEALDEEEARSKAEEMARVQGDPVPPRIETELLSLRRDRNG